MKMHLEIGIYGDKAEGTFNVSTIPRVGDTVVYGDRQGEVRTVIFDYDSNTTHVRAR